jgi:hypothetical protein
MAIERGRRMVGTDAGVKTVRLSRSDNQVVLIVVVSNYLFVIGVEGY